MEIRNGKPNWKELLANPSLSKAFREKIHWNQVDRIQSLSERERFVREVAGEFSGASFLSHFLLHSDSFDPENNTVRVAGPDWQFRPLVAKP